VGRGSRSNGQGEEFGLLMGLRTLANWVIKPAIFATGGVSQVTIIDGVCYIFGRAHWTAQSSDKNGRLKACSKLN